ncbi:MAG: NEW3 domain-containing protein [Thermoplasmata archaeon]
MRTVCGLLTILLILGPIGMGMLFNVDAPLLEDIPSTAEVESPSPEAHGTRTEPTEGPTYVNLYFHRTGTVMNTTEPWQTDFDGISGVTFVLDNPLKANLWVRDKVGASGMMAQVYLAGVNSVATISVYDNEGGDLIGTTDYGPFTTGATAINFDIPIPFEDEYNSNYNFSQGNRIAVEFSFTNLGQLRYDSVDRQSSLRLYCEPIEDIEITTYNFNNNLETLFYPKNIDEPVNRRQVQIKGAITDAFGNYDVHDVNIEIQPPSGGPIPKTAKWDRDTGTYNYTWFYSKNSVSGKYTITTEVVLEQGQTFSASNNFTMAEYGVLLTSPDQEGGEGTYLAQAKRNIIQNETTSYLINVNNIGNEPCTVEISTALTTLGRTWWNWYLEDENIILDSDKKSGKVENLVAGEIKSISLTIDGENKALIDYVGIVVYGICSEETSESHFLNTYTEVVVRYDLELEFLDHTKEQTKNVEMDSEVEYDFTVENTGGADDYIWVELGTPPGGWGMTLSGTKTDDPKFGQWGYVHLGPGDSTNLKLILTTPSSGGDVTAIIDITGKSYGSKQQGDTLVASDKITTTTIMTTGVKLEVIGEPSKDWDPGDDSLRYELQLTNTGTTTGNFTVTFDPPSSSDGWDIGDISLSQENFQLGPNTYETFQLWVEPTIEVLAKNHSISIRAENDDAPQARFDDKTVYCIVNEYYDIEVIEPVGLELESEAEPGEDVEYTIKIKNNGNTAEKVSIHVDKPKDWELSFDDASNLWSRDIEPQDIEEITFVLTVPEDAEGDETVDITVSVEPAESDTIHIETHTKIKGSMIQTLFILLVPILLFFVIIVMVIVIYKRR